jgi:Mrp family chromosome partitioning ATPase
MELFVSFSEIIHFYKRNWLKFLLVVLAFGIVGGLLPLKFMHHVYQGSTTFTVTCGVPNGADSDYHLQYTNILYSRVQSTIPLASGEELLKNTAEKAGVDPSEITKITAEMENSSPVVKLTASTTNASKAALISDTAAELLMRQLIQQFPEPVLTASISDHAAQVKPQSMKRSMVKAGILSAVLGFIFFVCFGILAVLSDKTIRNSRFAEKMLKVRLLAEIPHENRDRGSAVRTLRSAALNTVGGSRSFLVANVCEHNGGDRIASGFAAALAMTGKTVLLVDGDLRSPKLASQMKVSPEKTLNGVLDGEYTLLQAAVQVPQRSGLSFLSGAPSEGVNPADLFTEEKFAKFAREASDSYDYVVFYAPAEIRFPDAESLCVHAHSVILAVKYGSTPLNDLKESCSRISAAGGDVLGFVTTDV